VCAPSGKFISKKNKKNTKEKPSVLLVNSKAEMLLAYAALKLNNNF